MCLQIGCVNHDRLFFALLGGQSDYNLSKDAFLVSSLPAVVEGPVGSVLFGCVAPT